MSINATAVWRVRPGGNDANGAGYDSAISGAGTDYSQQDSPQLSVTDAVTNGTTTVTSATGGFTAAMIGNACYLSGTGVTSGYYFITARASSTSITVDRAPGTGTGGTLKVGGAAATLKKVLDSSRSIGDNVVSGNVIYVRGSGSNTPVTDDYTTTGFFSMVQGTSTALVKVIGENGRPRLKSDGFYLTNGQYIWLENLYLTASAATSGTSGVLRLSFGCTAKNLVIDTNTQTMTGLYLSGQANLVEDCEIKGSTSPTFSSGALGISINSQGCQVHRCNIHHIRDTGVYAVEGFHLSESRIWGCAGIGVHVGHTFTFGPANIDGNTIDGNAGHGINIANQAALTSLVIKNNLITNHNQASKYGIALAAGSAAANDLLKNIDYNRYYNNTLDLQNLSLDTNGGTGTNPGYTDRTNGDFTIGTALKALATPAYKDPGALQRQEATSAGSSGPIFQPRRQVSFPARFQRSRDRLLPGPTVFSTVYQPIAQRRFVHRRETRVQKVTRCVPIAQTPQPIVVRRTGPRVPVPYPVQSRRLVPVMSAKLPIFVRRTGPRVPVPYFVRRRESAAVLASILNQTVLLPQRRVVR
jgi:hypothetical protein